MTSPPSPPNWRRRRVVVAVAVLVFVSVVSWWYWPRGDARFVGKWKVSSVLNSNSSTRQISSVTTIILRPDGRAEAFDPSGKPFYAYAWSIEGGRYVIRT